MGSFAKDNWRQNYSSLSSVQVRQKKSFVYAPFIDLCACFCSQLVKKPGVSSRIYPVSRVTFFQVPENQKSRDYGFKRCLRGNVFANCFKYPDKGRGIISPVSLTQEGL